VRRLSPRDRARVRRGHAEGRTGQALPILLALVPAHVSPKEVDRLVEPAGIYDQLTNRVDLVKEATGGNRAEIENVLSHELTHALEFQALGGEVHRLESPLFDARETEMAVREGSATFDQVRYGIRFLGEPGPVSRRLQPGLATRAPTKLGRLAQTELDFVYVYGARFVNALYRRGGWRLVNSALRDPPTAAIDILQPRRWLAHEREHPPTGSAGPAIGHGWLRRAAGGFGAVNTEELFQEGGPPAAVDRLLRDWDGGRFELWQPRSAALNPRSPDRRAATVVVEWRWRHPVAVAAARAAVGAYLASTFHARLVGGDTWRWADGAAAYASTRDVSALVLAPTPALSLAAARAAVRP
jgi:hypothetical protein